MEDDDEEEEEDPNLVTTLIIVCAGLGVGFIVMTCLYLKKRQELKTHVPQVKITNELQNTTYHST